MNTFTEALKETLNLTETENGAATYRSTLNSVVDFFGISGALRTRSEDEIVQKFMAAFTEEPLTTLKILFYLRDIRGGIGERKTFRTILKLLAISHPEIVKKNFDNIVEFGRWDDFYELVTTPLNRDMFDYLKQQFIIDKSALRTGSNISLLAKWLKSENASSKETKLLGKLTREAFDISAKQYRKDLSELRKAIDIVERKLSKKEWSQIDYEKVPSKANLIYQKAFYRNDSDRYKEYLEQVVSGKKKINTSVNYPYEILRKLFNGAELTYLSLQFRYSGSDSINQDFINSNTVLWNNQPDYTNGENALVMADVSGSMHGIPIYISVSLALYFAERNKGAFHNLFMTFSSQPELIEVKGDTLYDKVININKSDWEMNTNLELAFVKILKTAVENQIPVEDMPTKLYIISDMEFDSCTHAKSTNFEAIENLYREAGYKRPIIIFWNVNSRNDNLPVKAGTAGTVLISGSSPSAFKYATASDVTPESFMKSVINQERYSCIVL